MRITNAVLEAAIQRATEAGLFPRRASVSGTVFNLEIMRSILNAALEAGPQGLRKVGDRHRVHG